MGDHWHRHVLMSWQTLPIPNLLPHLAKHTQSSLVALLGWDMDQEGPADLHPDPEEGMRGAGGLCPTQSPRAPAQGL